MALSCLAWLTQGINRHIPEPSSKCAHVALDFLARARQIRDDLVIFIKQIYLNGSFDITTAFSS